MEPTNRRETGTRPSALKRYGPFIAIIVVIAIVVGVLVVTGGSDDTKDKKADNSADVKTSGGPVMINDSNRDSIDWGPNCDPEVGKVKIPLTYAAPCVKPFKGDNGGATAQGVTADSIKIVAYIGDPAKNALQSASVKGAGADVSPTTAKETYQGYVDLFAKYYELYGRKIDLQFFDGTGGPMDEVAARADAKAIADMKPFAVLNGANQTPAWSDELAANGIMCLGNCSLAVPESFLKDHQPYLWGNGPTPEQASSLTAKFVSSVLNGKKAEFAGDALKDKKRVFGVAHYDTIDGQQTAAFAKLKSDLTAGGVKIAADLPFLLDLAKGQENARTMIAKLKAANVTTVIFTGDPLTPANLTQEATAQNYFPEWVIGSNVLVDIALFAAHLRPEAMGARVRPRADADADQPGRAGVVQPLQVGVRKAPAQQHVRRDHRGPDHPLHRPAAGRTGPHPRHVPGRLVPRSDLRGHAAQPNVVAGQARPVAGHRPGRHRRHRDPLVEPERHGRGRGRDRRKGALRVHEDGPALHARQDAHDRPGALRREVVDHHLRDDPEAVRAAGLPVAGEVAGPRLAGRAC